MSNKLLNSSLLLTTFALPFAVQAEKSQPNMVLFISDDLTYFDLGPYGSKDAKTPNLDQFAEEGMLFTHMYQAAPMSSPTRHNLYTGLWPMNSGAYPNHSMADLGTNSIVQHLAPAGYRVALVGKSHVHPESVFPFEYFPSLKNEVIDYEAINNFIASCKETNTPYCMFIASNQPHTPWNKGNVSQFNPKTLTLPPYYVDTENLRKDFCRYLAEINYMDNEFGTVLKILDKQNQRDNTVVVYLSEQGNSLPFAKWTCYDAGVHSACIVRWPDKIQAKSVSDAMVEYVDIVPTFLDLANTKPISKLDGKSFLPVLLGKKSKHKNYTFSQQTSRGIYSGGPYYGIRSVADKKFRYIINLTPEATFKNTEVNGRNFKEWLQLAETDAKAKELTYRYQHRPGQELYDLEKDPFCMTNIAYDPTYAKVVKKMDKILKKWMKSCGDKGQETEMEAFKHMPSRLKDYKPGNN